MVKSGGQEREGNNDGGRGPETAGAARRSEPVGFKGGELTVRFESPVLRQEVQAFRRAEILARLKLALPGQRIATLKCVLRG